MSTNDKFKRVEAMLYNYKNTVAEIKILKRDLEILENDYRGTGAIGYEEKTGSTNKFNSDVENEVIKRSEKIQRLKSKIRLKEIGVENIDAALESLLKEERYLIEKRYFDKIKYKIIAAELNISEDIVKGYRRTNIINKLIPMLIRDNSLE
ncbi:MAG: RNA polymerase subunit sigma [Clostridium sp.]|uniref:RNA polymerase subunit sigma n=1 Tax=Clostridium sp. TaxID=1506 RepID=UPI0028FE2E36|nr:RNA polymerase subunit sigma [Clostridium sp.]MDU1584846.1 RNA polymerase subunit sigma [Clostridium sp.]